MGTKKLIQNVAKKVRDRAGKYGAERVEKAADLVPNLEKQYSEEALYRAFTGEGDNASGLMVMHPRAFENYAEPLWEEHIEPQYIYDLAQIARQKGFSDVPFLMLHRDEIKNLPEELQLPRDMRELQITGHEGRHRTRALDKLGDEATLVRMLPRASMREHLPRRSQQEYIEALTKELGLDPFVRPEGDREDIRRLMKLPEIFKDGGRASLEQEFRQADMIPKYASAGAVKKATKAVTKAVEKATEDPFHPIGGGVKLKKPVSQYSFETIPDERFSPQVRRFLTPEDFLNKVGVPLIGDRAAAGKKLVSVEGIPLKEQIALEGGPEFMMNFPEVWSSEKSAAVKIANQVRKAAESGKDVLGVNVIGSPTNVDFNKMVSSVLLDRLDPTQLRKKDIKAFNAEMRKAYPDFVGVEHPELKDYLMSPKMGNVRTKFVQTMNKAKYQESGFPDTVSARIAVTEPELLNAETGAAGFTVGKFDPERLLIENPEIGHGTYGTSLGGDYFGSLEVPIEFRQMFPDFTEARRMLDKPVDRDLRSFTFQSPAIQEYNQEWLDKVMPTFEEIMKSKQYAHGGDVHMKNGGDLEEEFRKADMIDMSGFRQNPIDAAVNGALREPKKSKASIAKEVASDLYNELKQQAREETKAIKTRKGFKDLVRNVIGDTASMIEQSPLIPTLTGSSQNELAKLALTGMKGRKALEKEYANRKPSDLMGKELAAYSMEGDDEGMLRRAIMGDAQEMPFYSTLLGVGAPFAASSVAKGAKKLAPEVAKAIERTMIDPYKFNIVKPEGGQFIDSTLKDNLKELKQAGEDNEINKALNSWVDSTLRKYVVNRMGTESDEVRKLFDKGITHVDPEQLRGAPSTRMLEMHREKFPASGKRAETEVGQAWEDASDYSLYGRRRSSYDQRDVEKYPWLAKVDPEEMIYGASVNNEALKNNLGFGHVIDVIRDDLMSGKLRPEQLNKVSVEDAVKRTHQYNQDMARKAEETLAMQEEFLPKHREYPEGYKWVEVKHPTDKEKTEAALKYEGDSMGHCVGSYCEDVESGLTRIFSLRDAKGKPHVTIEVKPEEGVKYSQMAEVLGEETVDKMLESGMTPRQIVDSNPELQKLRTYSIRQIKGKGNKKPSSEYLPFVQDFVKNSPIGSEWQGIRDFQNTDLIDVRKMKEQGLLPDLDTQATNEIIREINRIYPMEVSPTGVNLFEGQHGRLIDNFDMLKREVEDIPSSYLTKEEILNHLRSKEVRPVEQSYSKFYETPEEPKMAGGGGIKKLAKRLAEKFEGEPQLVKQSPRDNPLPRSVAYNTYEQVPFAYSKHLEGMPEKSYLEKLDFTDEANWESDGDLLARYFGLKSEPSQRGVGLYTPPQEGAKLEMNPQISSRTRVSTDQEKRWRNEMTQKSQGDMSAMGAARGYFDVQGASPWVRPSEGGKRKYNSFHVVIDGKPTQEEMLKLGEIQDKYGFYGTSDLGKSGVFIGFNFDYGPKELKAMRQAFESDVRDALGKRLKGVKMVKSEGDYPGYENQWGIHELPKNVAGPERLEGSGAATRQFMEYLDSAKEQNPLLAEFYAQKPSAELQKLMESMNIRDIEAPAKYGVGQPRKDVLNARDIFAEYGIEGLRDALNRGEYLPAVGAVPVGIDLFKDNE